MSCLGRNIFTLCTFAVALSASLSACASFAPSSSVPRASVDSPGTTWAPGISTFEQLKRDPIHQGPDAPFPVQAAFEPWSSSLASSASSTALEWAPTLGNGPRSEALVEALPLNPKRADWESAPSMSEVDARTPWGTSFYFFWRAFKTTYSRFDGNRCLMTPSCSRFGYHAVRDHGLWGAVLTFGRLIRNHIDTEFYPQTPQGFLHDPVDAYLFGWMAPLQDRLHDRKHQAHGYYLHVEATRNHRHLPPPHKTGTERKEPKERP